MSASIEGHREMPASQYDLSTYWGRVRHAADLSDPRTLFVNKTQLQVAKQQVWAYKVGHQPNMTPVVWEAKKIVDATFHPDTGEPVFLPFRMSCFVLSNLVVTAGMLTPNLGTTGTLLWQITNQSLNVAINNANANKSSPLSTSQIATSYALAVSASCGVALGLNNWVKKTKRFTPGTRMILGRLVPFAAVASAGALNVFLMRGEEIRQGIDVYPKLNKYQKIDLDEHQIQRVESTSIGKSQKAATIAVSETALSRVLNSSPIMVLPPLILVRLQKQAWLKNNPRLVLPTNLALILATSIVALPLALGAFPQRQTIATKSLEPKFHKILGDDGTVVFNRGI